MTIEVIEGTAVPIEPERAVVPVQPGQVIVTDTTPDEMLGKATAIATSLARMVEAQQLYKTIGKKKYPFVEAWMTIGRMDNVVAREASTPVRHEDGTWEATVELVRLSDGLVIGNGSALCGSKGDTEWFNRADHHKRSMAVTRATSRAFRQQYSWIMALAGYEPTPADEMPQGDAPADSHDPGGLTGTVTKGRNPVDYELRYQPDGVPFTGFKLTQGRSALQVVAVEDLAEPLALLLPGLDGQTVTAWGRIEMVDWEKDGKVMPPYRRLILDRLQTPDAILPAAAA